MATQARSANGMIITFGGTPIPEVKNLTDIGFALGMFDVSAHDSGQWSSSIPTLKRGKPLTIEANLVPGNAAQIALRTSALNSTSVVTVVTFPTVGAPTVTFNAFVADYAVPSTPVDGALPLRVQLMPDGAMTYT